jgi:histidinol-phosphatase
VLVDDLVLAQRLADAADRITMDRFRAVDLQVRSKPDATPVTDADTAVERMVREELAQARPADAVLGEEEGLAEGTSGRRWVLDPIDGTKSFARGVPVWATLLALETGPDWTGQLAVVSAPALGRRWWAQRGGGAWAREPDGTVRQIRVSGVAALEDASFSYSSLSGWEQRGLLDGFLDLTRAVWRTRAYGDFWSHVLVAEGVVDLASEPQVSRWDLAAVALLVQEAGGRFTGLDGIDGPGQGSGLASNGRLHSSALRFLRSAG